MKGFDIERAIAAAKMMEGVHDFRAFMKISKEQKTVNFDASFATNYVFIINNNK